jgi:hypothetical protein
LKFVDQVLDPAPEIHCNLKSKNVLLESLEKYINNEEFSDIRFLVEGKPFYAHRIVLTLLRFRLSYNIVLVINSEPCLVQA